MLAQTTGDLDRADDHFEAATRFNLAMGSHLWVARTRYRHASFLLARNGSGDRDKAIAMIQLALGTCQSFGLETLANKLRVLDAPNLAAADAPDGTISLLFSDIEASTVMTEELGDIRAQELISAHRAIIREQLAAHQGYEVKTMGDGFMIAFASARRALLCAVAIQEAFESYNTQNPTRPIRVSVGLHTGEAIREAGDFYGKAVILASRIGGQARGGEILVSSTFRELTSTAGDFRFDSGREIPLKGFSGTHRVYAVLWRRESSSQ
jgi:class 3 adenylate cyclase